MKKYILHVFILMSMFVFLLFPLKTTAYTEYVSPFGVGDVFEDEAGYLKYKVTSTQLVCTSDGKTCVGTVRVVGRGSNKSNTKFYINEFVEYNTEDYTYVYLIKDIQPYAFKNDKVIRSLNINLESLIKKIPKGICQNCKNLEYVRLYSTKITEIGENAFYKCGKIRYLLVVSKKIKSVRKNAFKGISIYPDGEAACYVYKGKAKKYKKMFKKAKMDTNLIEIREIDDDYWDKYFKR